MRLDRKKNPPQVYQVMPHAASEAAQHSLASASLLAWSLGSWTLQQSRYRPPYSAAIGFAAANTCEYNAAEYVNLAKSFSRN